MQKNIKIIQTYIPYYQKHSENTIYFQNRKHTRALNCAAACKNLNGNRGLSCTTLNSIFQSSMSTYTRFFLAFCQVKKGLEYSQNFTECNSDLFLRVRVKKKKFLTHLIQLPCQANLRLCSS